MALRNHKSDAAILIGLVNGANMCRIDYWSAYHKLEASGMPIGILHRIFMGQSAEVRAKAILWITQNVKS